MLKKICLVLFLSCQTIAHAERFTGLVEHTDNTVSLLLKHKDLTKLELIPNTPQLAIYLQKLTTADYLSFNGEFNPTQDRIIVKSINYVGLNALLGSWETKTDCIVFTSYTSVYTFRKKSPSCALNSETMPVAKSSTYIINPKNENWSLIVSSNKRTTIGDLQIINNTLANIKLYNPDSGEVFSTFDINKQ